MERTKWNREAVERREFYTICSYKGREATTSHPHHLIETGGGAGGGREVIWFGLWRNILFSRLCVGARDISQGVEHMLSMCNVLSDT